MFKIDRPAYRKPISDSIVTVLLHGELSCLNAPNLHRYLMSVAGKQSKGS